MPALHASAPKPLGKHKKNDPRRRTADPHMTLPSFGRVQGVKYLLGLTFLALAAGLVLACGALADPEGTEGTDFRKGRRLQQAAGCAAHSLPGRTQRVMDECCPPAPPLQPGEEPSPISCSLPKSCGVLACAHEFMAFFDECAGSLNSAVESINLNCGELAQTVGQLLAILVENITLCRRWRPKRPM